MKINEIIESINNNHNDTKRIVEIAIYSSYLNTISSLDEILNATREVLTTRNLSNLESIKEELESILLMFNASMNTYKKFHEDVNSINNPDVQETLKKIDIWKNEVATKVKQLPKIFIK